jgi:mannonate dehydratase
MLIHSWRWFGPGDRVTLDQVIQAGAKNIVTALHHVPVGEIWSPGEIGKRKRMIERAGLSWGVVESVPVHEDIKKHTGRYKDYIEHYKQTLKNLGKEGIRTVCYNFIPALDWSRTRLAIKHSDGSEASGFDFTHFAAIDIHILKRPGAEGSYPDDIRKKAGQYYEELDSRRRKMLEETFLLGFPGSGETFSLPEVLERILGYREIGKPEFMGHLKEFLREIVPVAETEGIQLAIHPDDPPFPLLGLPRVVSSLEDAREIVASVDSAANGITFCTGSFGAAQANNLPLMARELARRINFLHIRNVVRDDRFNFHETNLLEGDVDVAGILKIIIMEDLRRSREQTGYTGIPVRPDHGAMILGDFDETYYPGYSLYGRLKNLAEIRGLEAGIRRSCLAS